MGASSPEAPSTERPTLAGCWSVLVVDDIPDNREMYAEYLTLCGLEVETAESAEDAFAKLATKIPNVIVMDVGLPKLDGIEATRRITADPRFANTAIIVVSGHAGQGFASRAIEAGADAFCEKPCTPLELLQKIVELLPPMDASPSAPTTATRKRSKERQNP